MSAAKRSHQGQRRPSGTASNTAISNHDSTVPASKRFKTSHTTDSHQATTLGSLLSADSSRTKLTAKLTNGVSEKNASKVDESRAVVAGGQDEHAIHDEVTGDGRNRERQASHTAITNGVNGVAHAHDEQRTGEDNDIAMAGADEDDGDLSFGDLLKARHPDIIDISAQLTNPEQARTISTSAQPVVGHSLATVLQQALKTNDKDLLESCFQLRDVVAIKNTIQRLPSPLVGQLLARVSERMYRRPGRAGALMIWIQWSLVAHGGYLASQPEILHKLKALNQVIKQRAQGLQPLLQLKGKLDMLNAQLELRREMQINQRSRAADTNEEDGVIYVEGDSEPAWDDDSESDFGARQIEAAPTTSRLDSNPTAVNASDDELDDFNPAQGDESQDEEEQEANSLEVADTGVLDLEAIESDGLEELSQDAEDDEDDDEDEEEDAEPDSEAESASGSEDDDDNSSHTSHSDNASLPARRSRRA